MTSQSTPTLSRRTVLRGAAGAAAAGTGLASADSAAAQSASGGNESSGGPPEPDYGEWFSGTSNYERTVDKRGQDSVTITVGAQGNGGGFAFAPAAVRVDPGTEIVWEWSGEGGQHNVAAEAGEFESELVSEAGHTFSHTVTGTGIRTYACTPHKPMGMRGAIVVGSPSSGGGGVAEALTLAGGLGLVGVLFGMFAQGANDDGR